MAETLDAMKYHDAGAFVSDVRLIFENAKKYNPPKHPIHVAASKLTKVRMPRMLHSYFWGKYPCVRALPPHSNFFHGDSRVTEYETDCVVGASWLVWLLFSYRCDVANIT